MVDKDEDIEFTRHVVLCCRRLWSSRATKASSGSARPRRCTC